MLNLLLLRKNIFNEQERTDNFKIINKGDKFAQGIFVKFLTVDNEEEIKTERKGGFGSTTKEG